MKPIFSYNTDLFIPVLAVSLSMHLVVVGFGHLMPEAPQVSVMKAPNSVEVVLIEEKVVPEVQEEVIQEEVIEKSKEEVFVQEVEKFVENSVKQIPEPVVIPKPLLKKSLPKEIVKPKLESIVSKDSKGAQVEAKPLDYVNPAPTYPKRARRRWWEGMVVLKVQVNANGKANQVEIFQSSGYRILDEAALKVVQTWQFSPAKAGNLTFSSWIKVPIEFKLIRS